jgi:Fe2+ transport system protein FeoA
MSKLMTAAYQQEWQPSYHRPVLPVCALQRGQEGAVVSVGISDPTLTNTLKRLGVVPGSVLSVIRNDPPYVIFRANEREIVIDDKVSSCIFAVLNEKV